MHVQMSFAMQLSIYVHVEKEYGYSIMLCTLPTFSVITLVHPLLKMNMKLLQIIILPYVI